VSVFRPAARVTTPDGLSWEIYAYKIRRPPRVPGKRAIRRVFKRLSALVVEAVRSLRSDEWTVEAIAWLPQKHTYTWTTTREFRGQVLAQVEGHLTRGDVPQHLTNAVYRGLTVSRSAR
jgi:hypothetical protein